MPLILSVAQHYIFTQKQDMPIPAQLAQVTNLASTGGAFLTEHSGYDVTDYTWLRYRTCNSSLFTQVIDLRYLKIHSATRTQVGDPRYPTNVFLAVGQVINLRLATCGVQRDSFSGGRANINAAPARG